MAWKEQNFSYQAHLLDADFQLQVEHGKLKSRLTCRFDIIARKLSITDWTDVFLAVHSSLLMTILPHAVVPCQEFLSTGQHKIRFNTRFSASPY